MWVSKVISLNIEEIGFLGREIYWYINFLEISQNKRMTPDKSQPRFVGEAVWLRPWEYFLCLLETKHNYKSNIFLAG